MSEGKTVVDPACAPAGLLRRLLAMVYDAVIVTGLWVVAGAVASPMDHGHQQALRDPLFTLYLVLVWFGYLAICWQRGGMTLGMRAWRLRLRPTGDRPLTWTSSLLRFSVSLLSAACFGLGFAWSLVDQRRRCWHDIASQTGVFPARDSD